MGLKFPTTATCHLCGPTKLWPMLVEITGKSYRELRQAFDGCFSSSFERPAANRPKTALKAPNGICRLSAPFRRYLRARGLKAGECGRVWGVRGIGMGGGRFAWRLYLPIRIGWETVSFTTRSINPDEKRRYISASAEEESYPHKRLLYGEELANHAVAVCEGPLDAISLGPGGVATFGVVVSSEQLRRISRFPVRVVVADNEPNAVRRAEKLCNDLEVFEGETFLFVPSGKDLLSSPEREREYVKRRWLT